MTGSGTSDVRDRRLEAVLGRLVATGRLTAAQATAVRTEYDAAGGPDTGSFAGGATGRPVTPGTTAPREGSATDAPETGRGPAAAGPVTVALGDRPAGPGPGWRQILPEVGGYVGAAFVVAATAVLVGPHWAALTRIQQILILAIPAVLLAGAAVAIARSAPGGWTPHAGAAATGRRRVVAVLLAFGSGLGAAAAGVAAGENAADRALLTTAAGLLIGAYLFCRSALLQLGALLAVALATVSWTAWWAQSQWDLENPSTAVGLALGAVAGGWAAATAAGWFDERRVGLLGAYGTGFVAAEIVAAGSTAPAIATVAYLALAGLSVTGFVGYARTRFVGHLVVAVVALATVVPQAVLDWTDGAFGAGGALLLVGLSIVGASLVGFRVRRI